MPLSFGLEFSSPEGTPAWTDITHDLGRDELRWSRGIYGSGPLDRLMRPGSLTGTLDNTGPDEADEEDETPEPLNGRYSPGHVNCLEHWRHGALIRLWLSDGTTTRYVWRGRIRSILPDPGVAGLRAVTFTATDWMADFGELDVSNLVLREDVRSDELIADLIDLATLPPCAVNLAVGLDTYPFAFDDLGGGSVKAAQVAQDILQSELSYLYIRGDETDGETVTFENRFTRALVPVSAVFDADDFLDATDALEVPSTLDAVVNQVEVLTVPRRVDTDNETVLIRLDQATEVAPGNPVRLFLDYQDPNNEAEFVGGADVQTPVTPTDWTANANQNGSGLDRSSDIQVAISAFGSRAMVLLTNTSATVAWVRGPGSAHGLQVRGRALSRYRPMVSAGTNQPSAELFGRRPLSMPILMPYQDDRNVGQGAAEFVAHVYGGLVKAPTRLTLATEMDDLLMTQGIVRDIGDAIQVSEAQTAIDGVKLFIQAIEQSISLNGRLRTSWIVAPGDTTNVLIFDDAEAGRLDENVFAFG